MEPACTQGSRLHGASPPSVRSVRGSPGAPDPENTDVETARTPAAARKACSRASGALASVGTEEPSWGRSETNELLSARAWRGWTLAFPPASVGDAVTVPP